MDNLPTQTKTAILAAIRSNQKLEAVKLYKDATECNLREAKEYIESLMSNSYETGPGRFAGDFSGIDDAETELILDAIFAERKLDAVKRYRDSSGRSLKESSDSRQDAKTQRHADYSFLSLRLRGLA